MSAHDWRGSPAAFLLVGLVVVAAGLSAWLLLVRGDATEAGDAVAGGGPVATTQASLAALELELGHPVYWAGEQEGTALELTRTAEDRVYVRYLAEDVEVGDPESAYLTVGTYPLAGAYDLLEQAAEREGAIVEDGPEGSLIVSNEDSPSSVYVGFPGEDYQVEVYDPDPNRALDLATSGQIEPAG